MHEHKFCWLFIVFLMLLYMMAFRNVRKKPKKAGVPIDTTTEFELGENSYWHLEEKGAERRRERLWMGDRVGRDKRSYERGRDGEQKTERSKSEMEAEGECVKKHLNLCSINAGRKLQNNQYFSHRFH